ncbi:acyltransferase [uncultured Mailhella sp.]|uniref:acyltransferase n=1 Tax=uncultured Mailhella sp. TaxID=1981031 RepID=UPI0026087D1C|nr:acyltransferase [uncultured Mailhella sp.]
MRYLLASARAVRQLGETHDAIDLSCLMTGYVLTRTEGIVYFSVKNSGGVIVNKIMVNLLASFIPSRKRRQEFRCLARLEHCAQENDIQIAEENKKYVDLHIEGKNNKIVIKKGFTGKVHMHIEGDNCTVIFEENVKVNDLLEIFLAGGIHKKIKNAVLYIGKNTSFESCRIFTCQSNTSIEIGEECIFSSETNLFHTDGHPIYDLQSGKIINKVKGLKIGDHCWIGKRATLLKDVELGRDSIVGWGSVVSRKFYAAAGLSCPPEHCVIAGNPAKVVKTGVTWRSVDESGAYARNEWDGESA